MPVWIKLRVSDEERARWLLKAGEAGMTLSALIRQGLDATRVRPRRRVETDPALLRALARIGSNLNQIARWANQHKQAAEARTVLAGLIEIDRELSALRRSLEAGKEEDEAGSSLPSSPSGASSVPPPPASPAC